MMVFFSMSLIAFSINWLSYLHSGHFSFVIRFHFSFKDLESHYVTLFPRSLGPAIWVSSQLKPRGKYQISPWDKQVPGIWMPVQSTEALPSALTDPFLRTRDKSTFLFK